MQKCPCASGKSFSQCCEPYITGKAMPQFPEQLMRSRYSAYRYKNSDYIWATNSPAQNQGSTLEQIKDFAEQVDFVRLEVLESDANSDYVRFRVWYLQQNTLAGFEENSYFKKIDGRWLYHIGELADLPNEVITRNQSCPCGSGKKFKRCHGG